ncbi:thioredoxin family protein [Flammeovirga yaeyamensis]|uniref:Thioredoxin family protein n=1 Tax=Flammeovirga yaeyamensis TaxID=367791 RepID=A0AAX1N7K0_9BACT|nr:thioredoxin family protein [Flammeovirga yaeyamensis]MBB3700577.1 thiol:disulfide interchange protein DsbD [Flammeovirga yaeyamensis]NMF37693.1 disulfide bond formation protein DsbD [Flammeovirga yaeyamensis]QWG02002.1 thioredoxin family protein [Flammeovirga yaeyamensis]
MKQFFKSFSFITILLLGTFITTQAQIINPVSWSATLSNDAPKEGEEVVITFKAKIKDGWYLYSNDFDHELGPIVTSTEFKPNATFQVADTLLPINSSEKYDEIWEGNIRYFKKEGTFKQTVKILDPNFKIEVTMNGQSCSDETGSCIPLQKDFTLEPKVDTSDESLLGFIISAFLFGLTAIFTPCVFPMIPLTVSFFTNQSGGKSKAFLYGFSIIAIYGFFGAVLAPLTGDPSVANAISTHWLPNTLFFIIFIVFALSFFGMFEITLPSSLVNKMDKQSDKGGLGAVFFMAFTLVLVSFSCTGPIVGTILIESVGGAFLKPIFGMIAFASAFALPFTLFALFPGLMKGLPKSGGWLNSVKVVLGFVELALAFKFLSTIDLVYNWRLLDKDIMVAIWIAISAMLGLYLLGKIRLPHDSPTDTISPPRMILATIVFTFVIYLIPGLFGAPLKLLSGILPPQTHHTFDLRGIIREEIEFAELSGGNKKETLIHPIKYEELFELPHGLKGYFDYDQALAASKKFGKPIFLDFTGHGCANCRKMEDNVWSDPRVLSRLKKDYIILALYVDDPTKLPEDEWITSTFDKNVKKTIGAKNFDFQITKFKSNAQPFYCLLNGEGDLLVNPKAYDLNVQNFVDYLDSGVAAFKK